MGVARVLAFLVGSIIISSLNINYNEDSEL